MPSKSTRDTKAAAIEAGTPWFQFLYIPNPGTRRGASLDMSGPISKEDASRVLAILTADAEPGATAETKKPLPPAPPASFSCDCGRSYNSANGLGQHRAKSADPKCIEVLPCGGCGLVSCVCT